MKINYFKIVWRNMMKSKVFSFINIFGLAIGITVCMMIYLFIMNEFSFDRFHTNEKNIYRVMRGFDDNGAKRKVPSTSPPYAPALISDFPHAIKRTLRVEYSNGLITVDNNSFNEKKVLMTDANFFSFFSFPLIEGDTATALKDPGSVVLTKSTAKKYFGNQNPVGKMIMMDQNLSLKVTGVAEDAPYNSHLDFDLIVPLANYAHFATFNDWPRNRLYTYVELNKSVSATQLEKSFPAFMDKYMGRDMTRMGMHFELSLTPLSEIYFEPFTSDAVRHGDKSIVYIFFSVAILILLIACINFMNLSTIRAVERSKEIGVRKVMGALRSGLIWQFIGESFILTIFACILSMGLLVAFMPLYNSILDQHLTISRALLPISLFLPAVTLSVVFLAGIYPAFFLTSFSPIESLKGKLSLGKKSVFFRQSMVVIQFGISVLLIIGTMIIMNQIKFVRNKDVGYNKEQTAVIKVDNLDLLNGREAFKNQLINNDNISSVSFMSGEPGGFFDGMTFDVEGKDGQMWKSQTEFSDLDYVKTLGLKIVAGRDFSSSFATDTSNAVLINQTAAAELGFTPEKAIGRWIQNVQRDSTKRLIVGVVQDFNFTSLKQKIAPLVIAPYLDYRVVLVRIKPGHLTPGIAAIKDAYNRVARSFPFEYSFLDQKFEVFYKKDIRQQTILSIFSSLAIFVACMGLFGLASFIIAKRVKEIGIRKVLGSSAQGIVLLLLKDLLKPVLVATIIAIPFGYFFMSRWLENFAYRTSLHWWIFILAAFIAIGIAIFTVCFHAIKAAIANPIRSLRSE